MTSRAAGWWCSERYLKMLKKIDEVAPEIGEIQALCEGLGIDLYLEDAAGGGECLVQEETIFIATRCDIPSFISLACHEICHILAYRNNKFIRYHEACGEVGELSDDDLRAVIFTGYRAELYVDRLAAKLCAEHFPHIKYNPCYGTLEAKEWYQENFLKDYLFDYRRRLGL